MCVNKHTNTQAYTHTHAHTHIHTGTGSNIPRANASVNPYLSQRLYGADSQAAIPTAAPASTAAPRFPAAHLLDIHEHTLARTHAPTRTHPHAHSHTHTGLWADSRSM